MATVNEKMTAIADEIRILSGTTEAMGLDAMATNVGEANGEIDSQTELLAQVVSALEGKAAGGGSGGGSVETCDVTINLIYSMMGFSEVAYTSIDTNGNLVYIYSGNVISGSSIKVVRNTIIYVLSLDVIDSTTSEGVTCLLENNNAHLFVCDSNSDAATITYYCSAGGSS